jgi:carbon-monoxide dehydrogenase medium subunit
MLNLREIHKPKTIDEAIRLLKQPNTVALAGGTGLMARKRNSARVHAVVDLNGLGLAYIRDLDGAIEIGATTTLAEVTTSPILRGAANGVVAEAAQRSAASLLRNQATVAGTCIAEPDGILAVALLALDTQVACVGAEMESVALSDFLTMRDHFLMCGIVTHISIPSDSLSRGSAIDIVARTPRDNPIVSVCAALAIENQSVRVAAIALGGVGEVAARARGAEQGLVNTALDGASIERAAKAAAEGIDPPTDYRGSAEYRRAMARVLTARVLRRIGAS